MLYIQKLKKKSHHKNNLSIRVGQGENVFWREIQTKALINILTNTLLSHGNCFISI